MNEFDELVGIVKKLREECPWDMEQTHESLSKHLIEEAYELLDSLAKLNDKDESFKNLEIELGDLLLQILLHSKIASENGYFSIVNVVDSLNKKLVKRHPHVFGDIKLDTPKEVEKQWERIKQEDQHSIFDDIDNNLPAITTAFNAPLGGVLFAIELILAELRTRSFIPIVVAAVIATTVGRGLTGDVAAFDSIPKYSLGSPSEYPFYIVLGLITGFAAAIFIRLLNLVETNIEKMEMVPVPFRTCLGGLCVGLIALSFPHVLGNGFGVTSDLISLDTDG